MTAKFVITGTNISVSFTYAASTIKVIETVKAAAKSIYGRSEIIAEQSSLTPFEELTNQQILDYLDKYILNMIIRKAKEQLKQEMMGDAVSSAIEAVNAEIEAKFL